MPLLLGLLAREAGKTFANGVAEVREALQDRLAYTTVLTVMRTLEEKDLIVRLLDRTLSAVRGVCSSRVCSAM